MDPAGAPAGALLGKPHLVAEAGSLAEGQRLHVCIEGRYVSVLRQKGRLTCIDSNCFHAGGPLGIGDIEEVNGKDCLVCPWHTYKIDMFTGEKYYQAVDWQEGKMVPGKWKSNGPRHRIHQVQEREDGIYVLLSEGGEMASDSYACNKDCGERILAAGVVAGRSRGGAAGHDPGADGTLRQKSGQILRHLERLK